MLHNKTTFGSRNASEGRFCVLHTVLIGLSDKFNEKVITYVRIKVISKENRIVSKEYETAYVYDQKGNVLLKKKRYGSRSGVY